ncbi:MAG: TRAP transporter small permease subunit [Pseudomonadota bacterium]|nr:TRAP transporter small permease subunit [Pseudomonadota bacterium]
MTRRSSALSLERIRRAYGLLLDAIVVVLMVAIAIEVTIGVVYRAIGQSLSWYDEVAVILLAWLTFYGSALAALKRAHIGFPGIANSLAPPLRLPVVVAGKVIVIGFIGLVGWIGYSILDILATDFLISLPSISVAWAQSVIPISCAMFVFAELLNLPDTLRAACGLGSASASDLAEHLH